MPSIDKSYSPTGQGTASLEEPSPPESAFVSQNRTLRFCIVFLLVSSALLVGPLLSIRTSAYMLLAANVWNAKLDYPFSLLNQSFDVVVFGDSTGAVGIDPQIISPLLNASAVNLSVTSGVLRAAGDFPLDFYLARNRKPKLLVLAISPENVSVSTKDAEVSSVDGWWVLTRNDGLASLAQRFFHHPRMLPALWSETIHEEIFDRGLIRQKAFKGDQQGISESAGWLRYPLQLGSLKSCRNLAAPKESLLRSHSYVNHFLDKYRGLGLEVAVFYTPLPDCYPRFNALKSWLSDVPALNEPYTVAQDLMANDVISTHALPEGAAQISRAFAVAVHPLLLKPAVN